jgi:hypothetical protein
MAFVSYVVQENISRKDAKIAKAQRRVKASDAPEGFDAPLRLFALCVFA